MNHVFERLLLATEHSEFDRGAEALAFALARRCGLPLAAVLPIASNPEYEALAPEIAARADALAADRLRGLQAMARAAGVDLRVQVRRGPDLALEIVDEAAERGADLLVIRRRGRRGILARLLVGEMVRSVLVRAACSVLVAPRAAQMWQRRVLVAVDPACADTTPLATAVAIAAECGLPLSAIAVGDGAAATLQRAAAAAQAAGVAVDTQSAQGRVHEAIVAAARACGADLIVIGRRSEEGLAHAWLGGVAQKTIGLAEPPVLVVATPQPHPTTPP